MAGTDSAIVAYSVCQGQPDTLKATVTGGAAPYIYTWYDTYNSSLPPFIGHSSSTVITPTFVVNDNISNQCGGCVPPYMYMFLKIWGCCPVLRPRSCHQSLNDCISCKSYRMGIYGVSTLTVTHSVYHICIHSPPALITDVIIKKE